MTNWQSKLYDSAYPGDAASTRAFLQWLAADYGLPEVPHVLDIGCGTGRMLREFAGMGWQATGMEPDMHYYLTALSAFQGQEQISVLPGGFAEIEAQATYDLIASINGPFSYITAVNERVDALRRSFAALKPGGVLFLDGPNFLWILKHYRDPLENEMVVDGKSVRHISKHEFDFHYGRWIHTDQFYVDLARPPIVKVNEMAIISPAELLYFVEQQGFTDIRTFNSYDARSSENWQSGRLMLAAQKPA